MKMKPILLRTEDVAAIIHCGKKKTRIVIKDQDITNQFDCEADGTPIAYIDQETGDSYPPTYPCKYQISDILYVRETYLEKPEEIGGGYLYKADIFEDELYLWKPSIHMPKEAARIFLRVTDVRVERLQDITEEEIFQDMGEVTCTVFSSTKNDITVPYDETFKPLLYESWRRHWDKTVPKHPNKFKRHKWYWDDNPWVWVIQFERISKEEAYNAENLL